MSDGAEGAAADEAPARAGPGQSWQAAGYARNARFVADLGSPVVALLAPEPGERILDLGCGDGALTAKLVAAGCEVVGIDSSPDMIAAARVLGLDARLADGEAFDLGQRFDAVFSNAAMHWMRRPERVVASVRRHLQPGGRFVAEFGGFGNIAAIRAALYAVMARHGFDPAALDPWYFPDTDAYSAVLTAAGFTLQEIQLIPRPTPLPTGLAGWLDTFAVAFLHAVPEAQRTALRDEVCDLLAPMLRMASGTWVADYVRLRFAAVAS